MVVLSGKLVVVILVMKGSFAIAVDDSKVDDAVRGLHCASFGYIHVPEPSEASQTLWVKFSVFLHASGQQRLVSLE